jgi:glyoxylase-like metal-dependent hydrolase (beta-lactamase superfamily II)
LTRLEPTTDARQQLGYRRNPASKSAPYKLRYTAVLRIHHISCGYFRSFCAALSYGEGGYFARGPYITHCLLIELRDFLLLVDTGLGAEDMRNPYGRLGFNMAFWGGASKGTPAIEHVRKLGFDPKDVRHIIMTHLDKDHTGGLADFPLATVHVHPLELESMRKAPGPAGRARYSALHLAHSPRWSPLPSGRSDWYGFNSPVSLPMLPPQIKIIPLPGHTLGHCGVAIQTPQGWLLHCGDASYHGYGILPPPMQVPWAIQKLEYFMAQDYKALQDTQARLREITGSEKARVFCSHDPVQFEKFGGFV